MSGCPPGDLVMLACSLVPLVTASSSFCLQLPPKRDETALQEEEELQLAIALSQSEAEEKERMVCALLGIWDCFFATQPAWIVQSTRLGLPTVPSHHEMPHPPTVPSLLLTG